jgi:hypothetical protein
VAGDVHLDEIKTRTDVYQNVTVTGHNDTDVFIVHSRGMANVKIKDLDAETLWRVGLGPEPESSEALAATPENGSGKMPAALAKMLESASAPMMEADLQQQVLGAISAEQAGLPLEFKPGPEQLNQMLPFLIGLLVAGFLIYLFFCFCLRLIVRKTGTEAGLLIWLPILQLIPMLRAAGMSMVWFFLWISPLLVALALPLLVMGSGVSEAQSAMGIASIVGMVTSVLQLLAAIVWCVKIVQARNKHILWAILLILPLTNLIAFLYLAFSSGEGEAQIEPEDDSGKIVIQSAFSEA